MAEITDWLMVGITLVYVIATIFICWANIKSAKAAKLQLQEMKKQYKKNNRPFVEAEFLFKKPFFYGVRFVNHGNHTAQHLKIKIDNNFINSLTNSKFSHMLLDVQGKEIALGVGQHYDLFFGTTKTDQTKNKTSFTGEIEYQFLDTTYKESFCINVHQHAKIFWTEDKNSYENETMKIMQEQVQALYDISAALLSIIPIEEKTESNAEEIINTLL